MTRALIALAIVLALVTGIDAPAQAPGPRLATLAGAVRAIGGQALPGAKVSLSADPAFLASPQSPAPAFSGKSTTADNKGNYRLENVGPGRYILSASAPGYVRQAFGGKPGFFGTYGGRPIPMAATPIVVTGGSEMSGLNIELVRSSAISGRVTSADGEPATGVPVYAVRWSYLDGTRRLLEQGRAATDEQGGYQIAGLAPGQYFIYAAPAGETSLEETMAPAAQPTYFPNALRISEAVQVILSAGADSFADIRLREDTQVTIRGTVIGQQGPAAGATVLLMQDADTPITGLTTGVPGPPSPPVPDATRTYRAIAQADANGEFALEGVVPGRHRLVAFGGRQVSLNMSSEMGSRWMRGPLAAATPDDGSVGSIEVAVRGEDLEGVTIALRPGGVITSTIRMEGVSFQEWARGQLEQVKGPVPETVRTAVLTSLPAVTLIPESGIAYGGNFPTRSDKNRGFTQTISPGKYFLMVSGSNQFYYVKSIRFGAEDVSRRPFEFSGGSVEMEITLGTDAGRVTGSVRDSDGNPVGGAPISLWPVLPDYTQRNGGILTGASTYDGSFLFPFVPPGEYYVIAFTDLPDPGLAQYPGFVSQFTSAGERIKVEPNQSAPASVKAVTAQQAGRAVAMLR